MGGTSLKFLSRDISEKYENYIELEGEMTTNN